MLVYHSVNYDKRVLVLIFFVGSLRQKAMVRVARG